MTSILGIAGGIVSSVGVYMQAQADAALAEWNANQAKVDAERARLAAAQQVELIGERATSLKGTSRAMAAAQGARADEGSPLQNLMQIASLSRRDQLRVQWQGEVAAAKYLTEAKVLRQKAENIRIIGTISAVATALSGAAVNYGSPERTNQPFDPGGLGVRGETQGVSLSDTVRSDWGGTGGMGSAGGMESGADYDAGGAMGAF